jgi:hypothetical protein
LSCAGSRHRADIPIQFPHFLRYAGYALGLDHTDGEAAQAADVLGAVALAGLYPSSGTAERLYSFVRVRVVTTGASNQVRERKSK